jgi:hypothetical protein
MQSSSCIGFEIKNAKKKEEFTGNCLKVVLQICAPKSLFVFINWAFKRADTGSKVHENKIMEGSEKLIL